MNRKITVTIPGNPIAKARPRFVRRGKFVKTYNPQETEEGRFMSHFHNKAWIEKPLSGPLSVWLEFYMPRPASHYGTGKNKDILKASSPAKHTKKPDIDNMVKFVLDSLNGYAWIDDSQIIEIQSSKRYTELYPRTHITIWEMDS